MTPDELMALVRGALEEGDGAVCFFRRVPGGLECIAFGDEEILDQLMGLDDGPRH